MKSRCAFRLVRTGTPAARRLAIAIATLMAAPSAPAIITHVWDASGVLTGSSGLWSTGLNWANNNPQIFSAGDTFDLSTLNITGNSISTVDSNVTLGIIQIGDSITRSNSWTLNSTGGAVITLDNGVANSQIHQTSSSFGDTLAVPLALMGGLDITNASATKALTITGGITSSAVSDIQTISNLGSAAGGLILSGIIGNGDTGGTIAITQNNANGSLTLAGANTFTGTTNITNGILQANHATALGNGGAITFGGGSLQFGSALNNATVDWGARINDSTTPIKLDTNGQAVTLAGSISATNTAGLTKTGAGTLTLKGAEAYTGATAVTGGTLLFSAASAPSFRYYRFTATANQGNQGYNQFSELHFYSNGVWIPATTGYGAPVNGGGEQNWANANDNNRGTKFGQNGVPYSITFDYGAVTTLDAYNWATANDSAPGRNPIKWSVQGSNDNSAWSMIDDRTAVSQGNGPAATYTWAGVTPANYILMPASGVPHDIGAANAWTMATYYNNLLPTSTALAIATGATVDLNGNSQQLASLGDYVTGVSYGTLQNSNTAAASTLTLNIAGSSSFTGLISGVINLDMAGAGTQVLAGANTYTGTTKISAGILQLGNNLTLQNSALDTTGAGVMNITGQATPTFGGLTASGAARDLAAVITTGYTGTVTALTLNPAAGSTFTYSGIIADGAAGMTLSKIGAGTQVLSGANTYTGATNISAGTLSLGNAATFTHTSAINLLGTGRLDVNVANQSLAKLAGGVPAGTFLRYSQAQTTGATGPGTILGTVELNVTNVDPNYTLDFGTGSSLTNVVAASYNVPVTVSGDAFITSSTAAFAGGAGMTLSASTSGAKNLTLTGSNTGANTLAGIIADGSGSIGITKNGAGTWILSGANTFTGGVSLGAGTLGLGSTTALGAAAGTLVISGGTLDSTVADLVNSNHNPVTLNGDFAFAGTQNLNLGTGNVSLGTAAGIARTLTVNAKTLTLGGSISDGTTATGLTKAGAGTLLLSGSANYSGTTTISGGALQATLGLPSGGFLALDGGVLQTSGTFTKNLGTSSPAFQFTANGGGFSANGGQLTVNIGNALAEQVWGSVVGTDVVGTLQFGSASANAKTLFENGIDLNGATRTINVTVGAGGDSAEMSGIIRTSSGSAGIIKTGAGSLTLSGANTYNGGTTLTQGTLRAGVAGAIPAGNLVFDVAGNTALLDINGFDTTLNGLTQGSASTTNKVVNNAVGTTKILTVGNNDASSIFAGVIANNSGTGGTLALTKTGAGTLTLASQNTYTGATVINGGTLRLLGAGAMQGASAITVNTTGTLLLDNNAASASVTTQPITLNGGTLGYSTVTNSNIVLNNNATSTVTNQSGASSFITIQAGGFGASGFFLDGGLKGSGTLTVNNATPGVGLNLRNTNSTFAGALIVNGTASTIASMASGIGVGGNTTGLQNADITLNGTLELQNQGLGWSNTRSATQTFLMGALNGTGVMIGNSNTANDTVTVTLGNTNTNGAFSGVIANGYNDTLSLVKTGTGIQNLAGANTYSGNTTIAQGTWQVGSNGAIPNVPGKGNVVFSVPANTAILD
ncbi:MAG: autotransporter-associated beta strand repeat-containing protein, partial [Verrucomicrobiota bacterium]